MHLLTSHTYYVIICNGFDVLKACFAKWEKITTKELRLKEVVMQDMTYQERNGLMARLGLFIHDPVKGGSVARLVQKMLEDLDRQSSATSNIQDVLQVVDCPPILFGAVPGTVLKCCFSDQNIFIPHGHHDHEVEEFFAGGIPATGRGHGISLRPLADMPLSDVVQALLGDRRSDQHMESWWLREDEITFSLLQIDLLIHRIMAGDVVPVFELGDYHNYVLVHNRHDDVAVLDTYSRNGVLAHAGQNVESAGPVQALSWNYDLWRLHDDIVVSPDDRIILRNIPPALVAALSKR